MTISFSTFFTRAGKFFFAGDTVNTAIGTTIEDEVEDATQALGTLSIEFETVRDGILDALQSFQSNGSALLSSAVRTPIERLLVETVLADNPQVDQSVDVALAELIRQMIAEADSLDASTPGATPGYDGGNTGDGIVVVSTKRGDGKVNEHILAETIACDVIDATSDGEATIDVTGAESVDLLSHEWPAGSAVSTTLTSLVGASTTNLITNGSFEDESDEIANVPDGWIASVATLGTTLILSDIEEQTVVLSGSPTSGYFLLHWTNADSKAQTTVPLAFNADAADVEEALQALTGLENVTVATTGTAPNLTHTITFTGVPNPGQLTSTEVFDTGSIAHNTTTAGSANVLRGARAVEIDSDGAELTTLNVRLTLQAGTQYAFNGFFKTDSAPAAGVLTVDLVDGIGGSVIADDEGTNNSFTIDATALTTSWVASNGVFRMPTNLPPIVYLRIRVSTAISNTSSIYIDECVLAEMSELYTGGLYATVFTGVAKWIIGDRATIAVTNDRAGALHEWMNRVFELRTKGLLMPTDASASETIADSLIA